MSEEVSFANTNPNVIVAVRVRPENEREKGTYRVLRVVDEHVIVFDPSNPNSKKTKGIPNNYLQNRDCKYAFDRVFSEVATSRDIYENTTQQLIDYVLNGYTASVFAYGATGSGKTHTMIGDKNCPGVMVLTMRDLFQEIENRKQEKRISVSISYLEIYNETIRDLLIENSPPLMLCEDPVKGTTVSNLSIAHPKNPEEVFQLLEYGNLHRSKSSTEANSQSSRSHAILQILIEQRDRTGDVRSEVKVGKLSLIDLAGSERACVSNNRGDRLKEGANINKSLLALGNCINSLGENFHEGKFIPYRNSKLTRLLKDSLGGNCRTVMIATASYSSLSYEDTLNTLKYANRAKNIKTNVEKNVVSVTHHISEYVGIIDELRKEITELKAKLEQKQSSNQDKSTLETNFELLKQFVIEQYSILSENNLANESHRIKYVNLIQQINQSNNFNSSILNNPPSRKRSASVIAVSPKSYKSPKRNENEKTPLPSVFVDEELIYENIESEESTSKSCQSPFTIGIKTPSKYSSIASPYRSPGKIKSHVKTPQRVTFPSDNLENIENVYVPVNKPSLKENQPPRSILKVKTAITPKKSSSSMISVLPKPTITTPNRPRIDLKRTGSIIDMSGSSKKPRATTFRN